MTPIHEDFTLYVLTPPSLNGEKSRWLFDYHGMRYKNHQLTLAPLSLLPALRYACKAKGSKYVYAVHKNGTPVFRNAELLAEYLDSFVAEQERFDQHLPEPLKSQYQAFFNKINSAIRSWSYGVYGVEGPFFKQIMTHNVPVTEKLFIYLIYPLLKPVIKFKSPAAKMAQLYSDLTEGLDQADLLFADGRRFINGEHFTYADIDFAVTVSPMIMPPEYSGSGLFPPLEKLPEHLRAIVEATRQRPTGQYVLNLYKTLRNANKTT